MAYNKKKIKTEYGVFANMIGFPICAAVIHATRDSFSTVAWRRHDVDRAEPPCYNVFRKE